MRWFDRIAGRLRARHEEPSEGGGTGTGGAEDGASCSSSSDACQEALEAVYEYLDGELADVPAEQVRAHFELCERCYPHLEFERSFLAAVRRGCRGAEAPSGLKDRVAKLLAESDAG